MEDGVNEEPAQCKEPKFLGKAGWVKKAPAKLLASYKDRFIHVEKTEIVMYENEDRKICLERLDLENYDKCQELKSPFNRKHRLILIRSVKSGNKVHDVKFLVQTAEEKEAWIKALTDGINRAKNKVFDEVKVDESSNLEHVTRSRPKGNRNRRPPTRIHMKEVAVVSSDGILRLDLDLEDAVMPNGTHDTTVDDTDTPKETIKALKSQSSTSEAAEKQSGPNVKEEAENEPPLSPQKTIIKPPMPPVKEAKPRSASENEDEKADGPEKKVLKPPMPPSKETKPCTLPVEESTKEATAEKSPDAKKKTVPPPTPPNKPSSSSLPSSLAETPQSSVHPPTPPSKEKKPSSSAKEPDRQDQDTSDESREEEGGRETMGPCVETDEADQLISRDALPKVNEDESHCAKGLVSDPTTSLQKALDTSASSLEVEEMLPKNEVPSVVVSLNDPLGDSLSLSPLLTHSPGEKKKGEEKSVDSGQHSEDDSEASESEDTLAASTAALRGSNPGLDVLDDKDNIHISATKHRVSSKVLPCQRSKPTTPLKPSSKAKSASIGDLLSDSLPLRQKTRHGSDRSPTDEVMKLETEVALEMENTSELLNKVSHSQGRDDEDGMPEELLAKAMEKLKKADHVLREVKKLKLVKTSTYRKSW
ncbi:pleckstrin homology domain-containing family O member 2 [Mastacembelus armatus]|uniref:Pleckstrin homology domain containing, family O member 2 n=1 Tax=Mastacembelus armatus TaxID=205130 RepID=A0A3Q3NEF6_9TELE|nr:pleckstrin homology domain-containing family O member 2 [Mastacembelus armatus]